MAIIIQKFGGTSVANPERINDVAERIARYHKSGHQIIAVVSAMSGETNNGRLAHGLTGTTYVSSAT